MLMKMFAQRLRKNSLKLATFVVLIFFSLLAVNDGHIRNTRFFNIHTFKESQSYIVVVRCGKLKCFS